MDEFTITTTWRSTHTLDLADVGLTREEAEAIDWSYLNNWPSEVLDQVDTSTAELVDWGVQL